MAVRPSVVRPEIVSPKRFAGRPVRRIYVAVERATRLPLTDTLTDCHDCSRKVSVSRVWLTHRSTDGSLNAFPSGIRSAATAGPAASRVNAATSPVRLTAQASAHGGAGSRPPGFARRERGTRWHGDDLDGTALAVTALVLGGIGAAAGWTHARRLTPMRSAERRDAVLGWSIVGALIGVLALAALAGLLG